MESKYYTLIALIIGFVLDQILGDPIQLPHPIVGFGKLISMAENKMNSGKHLLLKGAVMTTILVCLIFYFTNLIINTLTEFNQFLGTGISAIIVFYCLSARTLRKEVKQVFEALERSTAEGRTQLSRIVGRDTAQLQPQQIRTAALETLAENLSDGVIAPLFWFALLGVPGIMVYKMVNTLDSMIGYKTERYFLFGRFAARLDDVANFIPARLTALIMLLVSGNVSKIEFVISNGNKHASPNSGYPEAALAGILDCRFGGPNYYFGEIVQKPYIGITNKNLNKKDLERSLATNKRSETVMLLLVCLILFISTLFNSII
ncbi:MAG: adenosylcobinamide-phosphate synthase CbiB [Paludibacter sp.]|nr:adenosylcobinamide-phosphate synthase CbiB [Paludibacter sp.]